MKRVNRSIADFFTPTAGGGSFPEKDVKSCGSVRTYKKRKRSPVAATSSALISPRKTSEKKRKEAPQLYLDIGQKDFSGKKCPTCGFFYTPGVKVDEDLHSEIHKGGSKHIVHKGWKHERVVFHGVGNQGRIIQVSTLSPSLQWEKLTRVCELIEDEIGLAKSELLRGECKALLHILDSRVVGCAVFEGNCQGWNLVKVQGKGALVRKSAVEGLSPRSFPIRGVSKHSTLGKSGGHLEDRCPAPSSGVSTSKSCCNDEGSFSTTREINLKPKRKNFDLDAFKPSSEATKSVSENGEAKNVDMGSGETHEPVENDNGRKSEIAGECGGGQKKVVRVCGVRVVWVSPAYRRRGIASKMLDVLQSDLVVGRRCKLAFLQQTLDGEEFCSAYLGRKDYCLYTRDVSK